MAGLSRDIQPWWPQDDASRATPQPKAVTQGKGCWGSVPDTKLGWFSCSSPTVLLQLPFKAGRDTNGEKKPLCISESYDIIRWHFPSSLLITRTSSHKELVCTKPSVNLRSHRREIAELQIMTFNFNSLPQISIKLRSPVSRAHGTAMP